MLRYILLVAVAALTLTSTAFATPDQTEKQLVAWMKGNPALSGFKKTFDQNTAGNTYTAKVTVAGYHAEFSSEPYINGKVPREYIGFEDSTVKWNMMNNWDFNAKAFGAVYGSAVANDVLHPVNGFATRNNSLRQGKLFVYAAMPKGIMIAPRSQYKYYVGQLKSCDAIDCAGD